jgi:phosphate-selective porin
MKTLATLIHGAAAATVLATALPAQPQSIEDRLRFLETSLTALQQENAALRQQVGRDDRSTEAAVVRAAGRETSLRVGGVVQGQGEFGGAVDPRYNGVRDRFFLRRARLAAAAGFAEYFDFRMEADFGAGATAERTGVTTQITDVFVNWNRYKAANVKFGQFKTPFGYEQLIPDPKVLTVERSLPNDRLTDGRQVGLGVNGCVAQDRLSYAVSVFNGAGVNNSANDNSRFMWVGRLATPLFAGQLGGENAGINLGLNGLVTRDANSAKVGCGFDSVPGGAIDNVFAGRRTAIGLDAQFRVGRVGLDAEYLRADFHPTNRFPSPEVTADGWSLLASWFVVPKTLQAIGRYETFDPNNRLGANESNLWTLGLTWFVKGDDLKFALNYLLGEPAGSTTRPQRLLSRVQLVF